MTLNIQKLRKYYDQKKKFKNLGIFKVLIWIIPFFKPQSTCFEYFFLNYKKFFFLEIYQCFALAYPVITLAQCSPENVRARHCFIISWLKNFNSNLNFNWINRGLGFNPFLRKWKKSEFSKYNWTSENYYHTSMNYA